MKALKIVASISEVRVLFSLAFGQTTPPAPSANPDAAAGQDLTGIVSDAVCKGQHNRKAVTNYGCARKCVEDGADYALVVGRTVYILEGHRADLDKFAGGQATVTGQVVGNRVILDSVAPVKKKPKSITKPTHDSLPLLENLSAVQGLS